MAELERPLGEDYQILPFHETDQVGDDDVLELWERARAIPQATARRRLAQVLLVATHVTDGLVGVCSAYLQRNKQLRMNLWHFRAFVAPEHRASNVASVLSLQGLELLEHRFVTGADTRGSGIAYEVQNEGLQRMFTQAVWMLNDTEVVAYFIGESPRGRVSVRYFPGALAPTR